MTDRKIGTTGLPGVNQTTYYACGSCGGWFSRRSYAGGLGSRRTTPELRAKRQAEDQRVSHQVAHMRKCGCTRQPATLDFGIEAARPAKRQRTTQRQAPARQAATGSVTDDLTALTKLWKQGALTDDEFAAAKAAVLGSTPKDTTGPKSATRSEGNARPLPPAGWYQDPHDDRQLRYWDGANWTDYWQRRPQA